MPPSSQDQLPLFDYRLNIVKFPSVQHKLDLTKFLELPPESTFIFQTNADNVSFAEQGDYLVVDKTARTDSGDWVAVRVGEQCSVRLLWMDDDGEFWCITDKFGTKPFSLGTFHGDIIGKVLFVVKKVSATIMDVEI